jgi:exopolysaccharide biosynthesis polyprenyl glycosylphosphotransferase
MAAFMHMMSFYDSTVRRLSAAINAAVVLLVMIGVILVFNWHDMPTGLTGFLAIRITIKNLLLGTICLVGGAAAFCVFGLRETGTEPLWKELVKVTKAASATTVIALLFPLTSHARTLYSPAIYSCLPLAVMACVTGRLAARMFAERLARSFDEPRSLLIVGSGARALSLYTEVLKSSHRFEVLGFVESPQNDAIAADIRPHIIGTLDDLERILMKQAIDRVLITLPGRSCHAQIQTALTTCERAGVEAQCYIADIFELSVARPKFEPEGNVSVISMKVVQDDARLLAKRAIDILCALLALLVLGPVMLIIALAISFTSPGPAIFVQERFGFRKRCFRMFKFRTMDLNAETLQPELESRNEAHGPAFKMRNDPRVTRLGRWLRKTSLDELPQLFNVLKGEMSLVGPRPLPIRDVSRFTEGALMRRFSVKPGLTCLWQISGRSKTGFEDWIRLDLKYIDEWSLGLDFKILLKTLPVVLRADGAY